MATPAPLPVGAGLDSLFLRDPGQAAEIVPTAYHARPLWRRARERATRAVAPVF